MRHLLVAAAALFVACDPPPPPRPPEVRARDAAPALAALRAGHFVDATREASTVLAHDPRDAQLAAVRALATYIDAADHLNAQLRGVMDRADAVHYFDHEEGRAIWTQFLTELDTVDRDLAVAARDPDFSLELCVACWTEQDWNHNGRVDERDRHLFEVETDERGSDLAEGDPRRKPTFRFDAGDIQWARAMIAFQHAGVELVLGYRWSELDKLFLGQWHDGEGQRIVIHLVDADRVKRARKDILAGLELSAKERAAYLAETDDDREWVPNPRQKSHGMPFPVDDMLYQRWADLLGDAHGLVEGDDGVSLREVGRLVDRKLGAILPDAYVDIGAMLRDPQDIVIDLTGHDESPQTLERVARGLLGHGYVEKMHGSPLVGRLRLMMDDVDHGDETLERKLHYLMWLN